MEVPTATSLRDIYPEDALPVETKRWESLLAKFKDLYGKQAEFVSRSPGRVNIIGEVNPTLHIHFGAQLMVIAH
jgi:galactokinase